MFLLKNMIPKACTLAYLQTTSVGTTYLEWKTML